MMLFPARAGVILCVWPPTRLMPPVPRTRGGDPEDGKIDRGRWHCSPHARG